MSILKTENVSKYYRDGDGGDFCAVDDVSISIENASITALVGPSGSGKTTLLSLLSGLDQPSQGEVVFDDRELAKCSDTELARIRRRMGFIFQDYALLRRLSVLDNVGYPLIPRGVRRRERDERAHAALTELGINKCAGKRPEQLSGGEQQRVAVARALAAEPDVLFADEPTSNLDQESSAVLLDIFQRFCDAGTTIVIASHDPRVLEMATTVFHLDRGRISTSDCDEAE